MVRLVSTLMLGLVGEVETVGESVLVRGDEVKSEDPLSLSFFPKTRPRMPPLTEALLSEVPASLTTEHETAGMGRGECDVEKQVLQ